MLRMTERYSIILICFCHCFIVSRTFWPISDCFNVLKHFLKSSDLKSSDIWIMYKAHISFVYIKGETLHFNLDDAAKHLHERKWIDVERLHYLYEGVYHTLYTYTVYVLQKIKSLNKHQQLYIQF